MSATINGYVAYGHIAAQLQRYRLIAGAYAAALHVAALLCVALCQTLTVYHTPAGNADILLSLSPYQGVVKIGMATVLILREPTE